MDPFEFLNERLREAPSVAGSMLERLKSGESALFPVPYFFGGSPGSLVAPESAIPDVGTVEPGPMHSSSRYYAGDKYGYQSPESYKEIYKGFPKAYIDMINKTKITDVVPPRKKDPDDVGDFRSTDNKYYTGENYGFQSPESYNKVIGSYPAGYVKPSTTPAMPGNKTAPISNVGVETKTPTSLEEFFKFVREERKGGLEEKAVSFGRQQQIADQYAQISMEKSRENTARQVELENIKRWREIGIAQIEAETRSNALALGLMTTLQQPNRNTMDALSTAFAAGSAPFAGRVGRG
jgi:hypothetical protein